MQGVPKIFAEDRVLLGAARYWESIINEKTTKSRKEIKLKEKNQKNQRRMEKQMEIEKQTKNVITIYNHKGW
jgi:hypothetical protein